MRWLGLLLFLQLLLFSFVGCVTIPSGEELSSYASRLNERGISSCLEYQIQAVGYVTLRGVTATGGADLATCLGQRW
jgi:hypothetical protein